jgi:hypothetical protein
VKCLDRRIASIDSLRAIVAAWPASSTCGKVAWRFITEDARVKLLRLNPSIQ